MRELTFRETVGRAAAVPRKVMRIDLQQLRRGVPCKPQEARRGGMVAALKSECTSPVLRVASLRDVRHTEPCGTSKVRKKAAVSTRSAPRRKNAPAVLQRQ